MQKSRNSSKRWFQTLLLVLRLVWSFRCFALRSSGCELATTAKSRLQKVGQHGQGLETATDFGNGRPRQRLNGGWRIHCGRHHDFFGCGCHGCGPDDRRCGSGRSGALGRTDPRSDRAGFSAYAVQVSREGIGWGVITLHPVLCLVFLFVAGLDGSGYAQPEGACWGLANQWTRGFFAWRGRTSRNASTTSHSSGSPTPPRLALASGERVLGATVKQCGSRDSQFGHLLMGRPS